MLWVSISNEAARDALADLVAAPDAKLTMAGIRRFNDGGENEAVGELIDHFSEALQDIGDPARIPSRLVEKTITHTSYRPLRQYSVKWDPSSRFSLASTQVN
jgi:hypothetical protein